MTLLKEYKIYADLLKIVAIFAVIVQHVAAAIIYRVTTETPVWWVAHFYYSWSRFSVPIFLMVSGMFLLGGDKGAMAWDFYRRRLTKVIVPYLFWLILFYWWTLIFYHTSFDLKSLLLFIFQGYGKNSLTSHLWFMPMIIGLYVAAPFVKVFVRNSSPQMLTYFLVLAFIFSSIIPLVHHFTEIRVGLKESIFSWYVGYFVLGYFLSCQKWMVRKKSRSWLLGIVFCISWIMSLLITFMVNDSAEIDKSLYDFGSPFVVAMSVAVFLFFNKKNDFSVSLRLLSLIKKISSSVFGIYLIHVVVLRYLPIHVSLKYSVVELFFLIPFVAGCVFLFSFISIELLKCVPILKRLVVS